MSSADRPEPSTATTESTADRTIRLRLLAAVVALCAGVAALVIAILLVRSVLG